MAKPICICEDCDAKCCVSNIEVFSTDAVYSDESLTKKTDIENPHYDREMIVDGTKTKHDCKECNLYNLNKKEN